MPSNALELEGVSKAYEVGGIELIALDQVDLVVGPQEVLTLLGPSGSGKTTLLSIAGGLLSATSGRVSVGGQDITRLSARKLTAFRRERVGFIFQAVNLVPFLTARENLLVVAELARRKRSEAKRRADRLLEELGLGNRMGNLPAQLSGGERQRVAIGRALMNAPELVLIDEPTSALDSDLGQQVMELIVAEVKARGAAAIVVTHDARITRFGDRILNMADGRIAGITPRPEWTVGRPDPQAMPEAPAEPERPALPATRSHTLTQGERLWAPAAPDRPGPPAQVRPVATTTPGELPDDEPGPSIWPRPQPPPRLGAPRRQRPTPPPVRERPAAGLGDLGAPGGPGSLGGPGSTGSPGRDPAFARRAPGEPPAASGQWPPGDPAVPPLSPRTSDDIPVLGDLSLRTPRRSDPGLSGETPAARRDPGLSGETPAARRDPGLSGETPAARRDPAGPPFERGREQPPPQDLGAAAPPSRELRLTAAPELPVTPIPPRDLGPLPRQDMGVPAAPPPELGGPPFARRGPTDARADRRDPIGPPFGPDDEPLLPPVRRFRPPPTGRNPVVRPPQPPVAPPTRPSVFQTGEVPAARTGHPRQDIVGPPAERSVFPSGEWPEQRPAQPPGDTGEHRASAPVPGRRPLGPERSDGLPQRLPRQRYRRSTGSNPGLGPDVPEHEMLPPPLPALPPEPIPDRESSADLEWQPSARFEEGLVPRPEWLDGPEGDEPETDDRLWPGGWWGTEDDDA